MSSRRTSPGESSPPRAKRSKISNACDACQRRKSRCELVNDLGCHRCRILRTRCSLAGQDIPPQSFDASPPPVQAHGAGNTDLPLALDRLTATIEGLTQRMAAGGESLRSIGRPTAVNRSFASRAPGERLNSSHPLQGHTRVSLSTAALVAKGLNLQSQSRMTDSVMVGVVSKIVLEEACRATRAALASIMSPLLTENLLEAAHRCSFLTGCILSYAAKVSPSLFTPNQVRQLSSISHSNFANMPYANPTLDIVLGLLMTSLSPSEGDERDLGIVDAKDAAVRALALARRLGLDDVAWSWDEEDSQELEKDYKLPKLHKLIMWYSVLHRHQWVEIFSSASCTTSVVRYPFTHLFSHAKAVATGHWSIIHLAFEASILSLVETLAAPLQACRLARTYDDTRAEDLIRAWAISLSNLNDWRDDVGKTLAPTAAFLHINSLHLQIALSLKMSTEAAGLCPTPLLITNRLRLIMDFGSKMLDSGGRLAYFLYNTPFDLATLPVFNLTLSFLGFAALEQSRKLTQEDTPQESHPALVYKVELEALRAKLSAAHPAGPIIFKILDSGGPDPSWKDLSRHDDQTRAGEPLEWAGSDFAWPVSSSYDLFSFLDPAGMNDLQWTA